MKVEGKHILTVGEYMKDSVHGGIVSVLRCYEEGFDTFKFIPSSRGRGLAKKIGYDLFSLLRLGWKLFTDKDIRIVHIHTAAGGSFLKHRYYARLARLMGKKVIIHSHASSFTVWYDSLPEGKKRTVRRTLALADVLIVLSESWKRFFLTLGVPSGRIKVLHNIVPRPDEGFTKKWGGDRIRLLFLGEIGERKGVFDLLEAMEKLSLSCPGQFHLDIGGNGMEEELERRIDVMGLSGSVLFHGFVDGKMKETLLERAHAFVLPSRNEGLPISILEAMSRGCAIVSTPVGGIPEVVKDNGILVPPGDTEALKEALEALSYGDTLIRMGTRSEEIVKDYYPEAVLEELQKTYSELLADGTA